MRYVLTLVIVLVVLAAGALLFAWSGFYSIAATEHHWPITKSFIALLRDRSVEVRSGEIKPPDLNAPTLAEAAFPHYHGMCRLCHGAPGYPPEEFAKGLYPEPPAMASGRIQKSLSGAEMYWIVKHGLKMTGMPAFSPTHNEEELWGLVALAKQMPEMSPDHYQQKVEAMSSEAEMDGGHTHGNSTGEKEPGHTEGEEPEHGAAAEGRQE